MLSMIDQSMTQIIGSMTSRVILIRNDSESGCIFLTVRVLSNGFKVSILDCVVVTRVATVQVAHHHDEGIESLLEFLSLFHVFRHLEDQFVAGKAEFVVGQNRGNVRGFDAPLGSGLKMAQNPRQSKMGNH